MFGFQMSNKKVLGIISHVMPIIAVEPVSADDLRAAVEKAVLAVEWVANTLRKCLGPHWLAPKLRMR